MGCKCYHIPPSHPAITLLFGWHSIFSFLKKKTGKKKDDLYVNVTLHLLWSYYDIITPTSMPKHTHTHAHTHTHTRACAHTHTHTHTHVHTHTHICTHTHIHTQTHTGRQADTQAHIPRGRQTSTETYAGDIQPLPWWGGNRKDPGMVSMQWPSPACGWGPCTGQGALCAEALHGPETGNTFSCRRLYININNNSGVLGGPFSNEPLVHTVQTPVKNNQHQHIQC